MSATPKKPGTMSKQPKCYRCRMPVPLLPNGKREGPWELRDGSGKWLCMPCIVLMEAEAEMLTINRALDDAMSRHARHVQPALDCSLCAYGVV